MIKTHGLSHIALAVADPERSLQFYRSVFGVREYYPSHEPTAMRSRYGSRKVC
jgi:catechol 2,3-dioxygenase-like lactoylglutathione lyase family enzyme